MLETITAAEAKDEILNLIDKTAQSHRSILITTESNNAVLLSEEKVVRVLRMWTHYE